MNVRSKSALILVILMILIPIGNYFSIPLMLGVDFILGNIPVLMIAFLFHPLWALLAGILSGLSCIPIWHHPWAIPVFTAEAYFVSSVFYYKKKGGPVVLILLFWVIIGIPLGILVYTVFLKLDRQTLTLILLKQALNSFFSSSVASALLFLPLLKGSSINNEKINNRFYNLISSAMVITIMITLLSLMVVESRQSVKVSIHKSKKQIIHCSYQLDDAIGYWMNIQNNALKGVYRVLMDSESDHSLPSIQKQLELFSWTQDSFDAFILYDSDLNILASVPPSSQYEHLLKSEISSNRESPFARINLPSWGGAYMAATSAILRFDNGVTGFVMGYKRMNSVAALLNNAKKRDDQNITLLDGEGCVIASTKSYQAGLELPAQDTGQTQDLGEGVLYWFPEHSISEIQRFKRSKLILESSIGKTGWTIISDFSNKELFSSLIETTTRNMMIAVMCFIVINIILLVIARRMTGILDQLVYLSAGKMYGLKESDQPWPESSIMEFSLFSKSMKEIMAHQRRATSLLHTQNEKLYEMNEALVNSEENLRTTLNSIADGIIVIDGQKRVTIINPVAIIMSGKTQEEAVGSDIETILELEDEYSGVMNNDPFKGVLQSGIVIEPSIRYRIGADSNTVVTIGAAPIRISLNDRISGAVIVLRDITNEKRLEDQLRQSQKMEIVGQLAGGIAHDFNNLLGGMQGTINMMELDLAEDTSQRVNLNRMLMLIKRASDLTIKLLSFSRKGAVSIIPMDVHKVVGETMCLIEHTFPENIHLRAGLTASHSLILGDATEIQRLLMNLCLNSRDAMPEGGAISISTEELAGGAAVETLNGIERLEQDSILLKVVDDGFGINKDVLTHIFEPFFTTKDLRQGSGLGLSAVYGTMLSHQGIIMVDSSEKEGTSFLLYFPLLKENGPNED